MPPADFKVLVIGAGMVGINAAVKLRQAGFNFTVLESRHEIGGTWSVNRYPGAAVDTPSILYSYSFEPNPSWTKYYPTGPEYLAFLKRLARKYRLHDNIKLNTEMTSAYWDEARQIWVVTAKSEGKGIVYEAKAVITSVDMLSRQRWPNVENLTAFDGPVLHSAQWDETVDLKDKHVVLVRTGCSGVQLARAVPLGRPPAGSDGRLFRQQQGRWLSHLHLVTA